MSENELRGQVLRMVLTEMAKAGTLFVPVTASSRHAHLSRRDMEALFGPRHQLTPLRDLIQPGQYACREQVVLETGKGRLTLRVVGPVRQETQVELTLTDSVKLGVLPPIRMSGDLEGSLGCALAHEGRRVILSRGVIVTARHLHLSVEEAAAFGLADGDVVRLALEGQRKAVLGNVAVRSGQGHRMEAHIDTDEANACGLAEGQLGRVLPGGRREWPEVPFTPASPIGSLAAGALTMSAGSEAPVTPALPVYALTSGTPGTAGAPMTDLDISEGKSLLLTEEDVRQAARNGYRRIRCGEGAIVTPLARDLARDKGVELMEMR